ncbi:MAG TPA: hypothetical protein VIJ38_08375 [Acidobacteriaceae bacterium]
MKFGMNVAGVLFLSSAAMICVAAKVTPVEAQTTAPMRLIKTVTLPGVYTGDFDHFAVDMQRGRLVLAAEGHSSLEVFDLKTGDHLKTVTGFDSPHAVLMRPGGAPIVVVTDSGTSMTKVVNANKYAITGSIKLIPGADSATYDPQANIYYIAVGGKNADMAHGTIAAVNPVTGKELSSITFNDNHLEAIALEENGDRMFVNLVQSNKVAVVNRKTMKEIAEWPVPPATQNGMLMFEEAQHRLYVVCRADKSGKPAGMVVVMNSDNGKVIDTMSAPMKADQLMYEADKHRMFVPGGQGYTEIYDTSDPNHIKVVAKVTTEVGAKTGMILPGGKRMVLAVSEGDASGSPKILFFALQ